MAACGYEPLVVSVSIRTAIINTEVRSWNGNTVNIKFPTGCSICASADICLSGIFHKCFRKCKFDLTRCFVPPFYWILPYPRLCTITPSYSFVPESAMHREEHFADRDSLLLCVLIVCVPHEWRNDGVCVFVCLRESDDWAVSQGWAAWIDHHSPYTHWVG